MKKQRKKERFIAWIAVIFVLLVLGAIVAGACVIASKYLSEKKAISINQIEEISENSTEELSANEADLEEALDEEKINEIFQNTVSDEELSDSTASQDDLILQAQAEGMLEQMSLEQKIAQLFFIRQESITNVAVCTAAGNATKEALQKYPVGGIIYFADNIKDPEQLSEMTSNVQSYAKEITGFPIFIGVDEEGGVVSRIASNSEFDVPVYDSMAEIGESGDTAKAKKAGEDIGTYLKEYGFNVDFAPDADVITESENKVVSDRSFGSDPQKVADMVEAYMEGLHDNGIYGCPKHYPGHGGTKEDSHKGAAYSERTWEELLSAELVPFQKAIENNTKFIMVSHICVPDLTGDEVPASLSRILINEKLRNELGYQNIIITDAMNMKAVTDNYSSSEAAVKALEAGVDMILQPNDFEEAFEGVKAAVEDGTLTEERIDESVLRILKVKLYNWQ